MKNLLVVLSVVALMFSLSFAQDAAAPAAEKAPKAEKAAKAKSEVLEGKVVSVDTAAKTLVVAVGADNKTFTVKKAASIAKLKADDMVKVTVKAGTDEAVKVAKVAAKKASKKEKKAEAAPAAEPAAPAAK